MANKNCKNNDIAKNWYYGVFEVAEFESNLIMLKFKMADPIWQTEIVQKNLI